ncbi:MAG: hypothetical protein IPQ07_15220 [Myxococcales bacterium]|nr:hypothetical protein [Myxococcales bacterium]
MTEPSQLSQLLGALLRDAAWENEAGARHHAEAIARLGSDAAVNALLGVLEQMAAVDLTDDAGDVSDECWRASSAAVHGLVLLGKVAVPGLRAMANGAPSRAREYAASALRTLGKGV